MAWDGGTASVKDLWDVFRTRSWRYMSSTTGLSTQTSSLLLMEVLCFFSQFLSKYKASLSLSPSWWQTVSLCVMCPEADGWGRISSQDSRSNARIQSKWTCVFICHIQMSYSSARGLLTTESGAKQHLQENMSSTHASLTSLLPSVLIKRLFSFLTGLTNFPSLNIYQQPDLCLPYNSPRVSSVFMIHYTFTCVICGRDRSPALFGRNKEMLAVEGVYC